MSFNADDPLAGILSDGSDDSFFDDDILGKKAPTKKKESTITFEKKKTLFHIGESQNPKPSENSFTSKKINSTESNKNSKERVTGNTLGNKLSPAPMKRTFSKDSININKELKPNTEKTEIIKSPLKSKVIKNLDKIDILQETNEDNKTVKPVEKGRSTQSLMDDILGGPPFKISASRPNTSTTAKNQDTDFDSLIGKSESKQTLISSKASKSVPSKLESKQDVKKRSDDWLGIFQDKDDDLQEEESSMPSWLTGKKPKEVTKERKTESEHVKPDKKETVKEGKIVDNITKLDNVNPIHNKVFENDNDVTLGAAMCMQEQEAQLMVALQLKAQEEKLAAMQIRQRETQRVQREAEVAHHEQLDAMLHRQAENRRQMQAIIASHQDRITQRIKALLLNTQDSDGSPTEEFNSSDKESPYSKEKKQLLQLVQSLQENHDKEIDLMETSYRRQLEFLEVSYSQAEERMKDESDKLVKFYTEKISWLDDHHQLYKRMAEENLNSITDRHKVENDVLRQQHLDNIKVLQEHHAALMENIKNAVKQEQILIKDSAGFSSDLHELVADVKDNNNRCQQLYEKVQVLVQDTHKDTERSLQIREKQINDMIAQLQKDREDFERDKIESKDMVKMLEGRLRQMTTMIEDETASLRQKKMEFEFEKATFSKQTEFAKNVLKKQDEELKILKDELQKEYQDKMTRIEEERSKAIKDSAAIAKEKSSIQNLKSEMEKTKAELDAHLQGVTEEKSKLNARKQELHIEEQRIMSKSRDLDLLSKSAIEKQSHAEKKLSEANLIQQKYEDRIRRIQEHVVSLNLREKQIAKEKVALSRERLSLHNERKELDARQCSLCRSNTNYNDFIPDPMAPIVQRNYVSRDINNWRDIHTINRDVNLNRDNVANFNDVQMELSQFVERTYFEDKREVDRENVVETTQRGESEHLKSYMDPKFMMLRLDVQKVISNLSQKKNDEELRNQERNDM
ncbi:unnamed protein product [Leptosia nina]|uniref:Fas-binding factor 1 C-terminal domain-containing protein n=1 Tax=Leptosia nina TaxID=320188 RepID=A0AAV1J6G5_9NEOP